MGEVYLAVDAVLERQVAVKVLSEKHAREPEIRGRFEREGLAAARLSRERHVVTVFDVGQHGGRPFIVMEYLDGGSVHERLARGPVPYELALTWLEQVGRALDRAHQHGVVHRDVKPANLLLDSEGNVRVSDFGIASAAGFDELTLPGTVLGTAGYLSPEQARGEPATAASDRYALGVIAFELLTGERPFAGDTPATQAFAHVNAPVPSATEVAPSLPPGVDRVLERALAKDPRERPATCAELVDELRAALEPGPAVVSLQPAPVPVPPVATERTAVLRSTAAGSRRTYVARHRMRSAAGAAGRAVAALGGAVAALAAGSRRRPQATVVGVAAATLAVALLAALVVDAGRDGQASESVSPPATTGPPPATTSPPPEETIAEPEVAGAALNAQGYELMQQGRFEEALPLLRQAVTALLGSGVLDEAYASYNLAFTRFALGRCDVLGLLDRSERIQGERSEIDDLRRTWEASCAPSDEGGDGDGDGGKGRGKGKGRGNGNGRG